MSFSSAYKSSRCGQETSRRRNFPCVEFCKRQFWISGSACRSPPMMQQQSRRAMRRSDLGEIITTTARSNWSADLAPQRECETRHDHQFDGSMPHHQATDATRTSFFLMQTDAVTTDAHNILLPQKRRREQPRSGNLIGNSIRNRSGRMATSLFPVLDLPETPPLHPHETNSVAQETHRSNSIWRIVVQCPHRPIELDNRAVVKTNHMRACRRTVSGS